MKKVFLCVPCFNESKRLPHFIQQIELCLNDVQKLQLQIHICFLNDGSTSEETQKMHNLIEGHNFSQIKFELVSFAMNRGKGAVLRDGFKQALLQDVDYIGFCDGDGATSFPEVLKIINAFSIYPDKDVIIGSRWKALGYEVSRSLKRHYSGRIFATILSNLFKIPVYDSQCGAKFFKRSIITTQLLDLCYDDKWLFDTQMLINLYNSKKNILEFPINWQDQPDSKVFLIRDSWRMFWGLWKFKKYLKTLNITNS